jgi:hypothetical protein
MRRIALHRADILESYSSVGSVPQQEFDFLMMASHVVALFDTMRRLEMDYVHGGGTRTPWRDMEVAFANFASYLDTVPL